MLRSIQNHHLTRRLVERVEARVLAITKWLERFFVVRLIGRTIVEMSNDDSTHMAAGVAYYALFSIFPLLLGLAAALSFVGLENIQQSMTEFFVSYLPGSGDFVTRNIRGVPGALGIIAVVGLFWSGSAIFGAITRAVNRAWDVQRDRPLYIGKPRQLAMALGVGCLFLLSIGATTLINVTDEIGMGDVPILNQFDYFFGRGIVQGTSYFFTICIFLLIYKFLPNTKTYWLYVWPGAVVAAVLFEISKSLFIVYLENFASFNTLYGSLSPAIVFLFWTYIVALILILGAELSSEYGRMMMGIGRGELIHPRDEARVQVGQGNGSGTDLTGLDGTDEHHHSGRHGYIRRPHHEVLTDEAIEEARDK